MPNIKTLAKSGKAHIAHRVGAYNGNGAGAPIDLLGHGHRWPHSIHITNELRTAILRREACACAHESTGRRTHEEVEK